MLNKGQIIIFFIIFVAALMRVWCALGTPLTGDEAGASLKYASGQARVFHKSNHEAPVDIREVKKYLSYNSSFSLKDVTDALKNNTVHPPLYYFILHYILGLAGNGAFMLRCVSIILSLWGIYFIYRLGRQICNKEAGLYAALFYAISMYGISHSFMVRPYPLVTLLSLVSTSLAYELNKKGAFKINDKKFLLYIATVVLGLYTLYHFIFVFIFQLIFFMLYNFKDKKSMFKIALVVFITALAYAPWLPVLSHQFFQKAMLADRYFRGNNSFFLFLQQLVSVNFELHGISMVVKFTIKAIAAAMHAVVIFSIYFLLKEKIRRTFIIALCAYILLYFVTDKALHTISMNIEKFFFFIMPAFFLLLGIGFAKIPGKYRIKTIAVSLYCVLLLHGSAILCYTKPISDGSADLKPLLNRINNYSSENKKILIIVNTKNGYFLLPTVHGIKGAADIKTLNGRGSGQMIFDVSNTEKYQRIFLINYYPLRNKKLFLSSDDIKIVADYLAKDNFDLVESAVLMPGKKDFFMIFKKGD